MPDGTILDTTPPTATPSLAAPAPQPTATPATVYTQEQFDAGVRQAHDSAAASVRRSLEGRARPADPAPIARTEPNPQPPASNVEQMATMVAQAVARESAFGESVRQYGFDDAQIAVLRSLHDAANLPTADAVRAFVKEKAPVFGKSTATPTATNNATPAVPAPIAPGSIGTAVPLERDVSVLEMSPDQVHDLMRKKGGNAANPYHPSNRAARREIRVQTEAALRNRRIGVSK